MHQLMYRITPKKELGKKRLRLFYMVADGIVPREYKKCLPTTVPGWRLARVMSAVASGVGLEAHQVVFTRD